MDVFIETLHVYKNNTVIQKYCVFIVLLVQSTNKYNYRIGLLKLNKTKLKLNIFKQKKTKTKQENPVWKRTKTKLTKKAKGENEINKKNTS